ncbi:outer membrane lipoprotein [Lasius niger]|uniref:Outer membrane lipoprotein n=1 Tax=Lasius niger TaxID=67767 RepID=A0A0J7KIE7_LASNI|nr:outer membrane lipoprotein [Lasius niger]
MKLRARFLKGASLFSAMTGLALLSGCYTPVEDLKPTTFGQDQLNVASTGRLVTILSVMPARATVGNTNKDADGLVGVFESPQLHPQSLVLAYQDPNNPQIQNTIEIAKPCEFKTGTAYAVLIDGQTKIQPNNFEECQRIASIKKTNGHKVANQVAVQDAAVAPAPEPASVPAAPQYATPAPQGSAPAAPSSGWQNNVTRPRNPAEQALQLQSQQNWPRPQTTSNN